MIRGISLLFRLLIGLVVFGLVAVGADSRAAPAPHLAGLDGMAQAAVTEGDVSR